MDAWPECESDYVLFAEPASQRIPGRTYVVASWIILQVTDVHFPLACPSMQDG
jgi:hypothetical protein